VEGSDPYCIFGQHWTWTHKLFKWKGLWHVQKGTTSSVTGSVISVQIIITQMGNILDQ